MEDNNRTKQKNRVLRQPLQPRGSGQRIRLPERLACFVEEFRELLLRHDVRDCRLPGHGGVEFEFHDLPTLTLQYARGIDGGDWLEISLSTASVVLVRGEPVAEAGDDDSCIF